MNYLKKILPLLFLTIVGEAVAQDTIPQDTTQDETPQPAWGFTSTRFNAGVGAIGSCQTGNPAAFGEVGVSAQIAKPEIPVTFYIGALINIAGMSEKFNEISDEKTIQTKLIEYSLRAGLSADVLFQAFLDTKIGLGINSGFISATKNTNTLYIKPTSSFTPNHKGSQGELGAYIQFLVKLNTNLKNFDNGVKLGLGAETGIDFNNITNKVTPKIGVYITAEQILEALKNRNK